MLAGRRAHDDRAAPQARIFLLFDAGEIAVQIKEQPAQPGFVHGPFLSCLKRT
jgi:hypothetical protein